MNHWTKPTRSGFFSLKRGIYTLKLELQEELAGGLADGNYNGALVSKSSFQSLHLHFKGQNCCNLSLWEPWQMCTGDWMHFAIFMSCNLDCDVSVGWAPYSGKSEVASFREKIAILRSEAI